MVAIKLLFNDKSTFSYFSINFKILTNVRTTRQTIVLRNQQNAKIFREVMNANA